MQNVPHNLFFASALSSDHLSINSNVYITVHKYADQSKTNAAIAKSIFHHKLRYNKHHKNKARSVQIILRNERKGSEIGLKNLNYIRLREICTAAKFSDENFYFKC